VFEDKNSSRDIADNLPLSFEIKSNLQEQRPNSQPTPIHAGGDHKFSAAAAFGAPIENFGTVARPVAPPCRNTAEAEAEENCFVHLPSERLQVGPTVKRACVM